MIKLMAQTVEVMSRCFYLGLVTIDDALFGCLQLDDITADGDDDNLDANQQRIRESLLRIRRDLDQINIAELIDDMNQLFDEAFGGPQGFVQTMRAWADLVDTLVHETEREFGSESGRGAYKKRTVKGAMLYMVSRSDVDIPRVPAFLEPLVWDVAFDALIDIVARVINRNDLWEDVKLKPSLRARLSVEAHRAGSVLEALVRWLSKVAWKIVFAASPVPPSVKKAVDEYLLVNPQPVRTVVIVGAWITSHAQTLATLSDLISVMVVEAQIVIHSNEDEKKAYARDLVLAFIDQEIGLPRAGTLRYRLLVTVVEVGIEVVVMLFEKHTVFSTTPTPERLTVEAPAAEHYDSYWPWKASEPVRFRHQ